MKSLRALREEQTEQTARRLSLGAAEADGPAATSPRGGAAGVGSDPLLATAGRPRRPSLTPLSPTDQMRAGTASRPELAPLPTAGADTEAEAAALEKEARRRRRRRRRRDREEDGGTAEPDGVAAADGAGDGDGLGSTVESRPGAQREASTDAKSTRRRSRRGGLVDDRPHAAAEDSGDAPFAGEDKHTAEELARREEKNEDKKPAPILSAGEEGAEQEKHGGAVVAAAAAVDGSQSASPAAAEPSPERSPRRRFSPLAGRSAGLERPKWGKAAARRKGREDEQAAASEDESEQRGNKGGAPQPLRTGTAAATALEPAAAAAVITAGPTAAGLPLGDDGPAPGPGTNPDDFLSPDEGENNEEADGRDGRERGRGEEAGSPFAGRRLGGRLGDRMAKAGRGLMKTRLGGPPGGKKAKEEEGGAGGDGDGDGEPEGRGRRRPPGPEEDSDASRGRSSRSASSDNDRRGGRRGRVRHGGSRGGSSGGGSDGGDGGGGGGGGGGGSGGGGGGEAKSREKGPGGKERGAGGRVQRQQGAARDPAADKEVTLGHVVERKMRELGYIRKPPVQQLRNRRSLRDRVAADRAPEVHFLGELRGATGFGSGISCKFAIEAGKHWTCLAGLEGGQTHVVTTDAGDGALASWNHPLDLHYTTKSLQGWPRVMLQVWKLDDYGRNVLQGYGFRHLPTTPGCSEVTVPCWRPSGSMQEEIASFFLDLAPQLTSQDVLFNRAWEQRCRLVTVPAGTAVLRVSVVLRHMAEQNVDMVL